VRLNKAVFESPEFRELWDRIKFKTTYKVEFEYEALINRCADKIKENLVAGKAKLTYSTARVEISRGRIGLSDVTQAPYIYNVKDYEIPDVLSYLQNETNLKRQTILDILLRSKRLGVFKDNPQKFIDEVKHIIKCEMQLLIVEGIKYQKIGDQHFYAQELFQSEELIGYLNKNMRETRRCVYDHVVYDSSVEAHFAQSFEEYEHVKVYAKLPGWFKIDTPLGSYNPDWAVLFELEGQERLYFVVESKGAVSEDMLRGTEHAKIKCGKAHFKALYPDADYFVANKMGTLINQICARVRPL